MERQPTPLLYRLITMKTPQTMPSAPALGAEQQRQQLLMGRRLRLTTGAQRWGL